jgi:hypothetical protein
MSKPKIVVTRRWHEDVEAKLCELFDTQLNASDQAMTVADLQSALQRADAVLPTVSDKINAEVLGVGSMRAKMLGSNGVGFNHIDLDAAKAAGLTVTNTPEVLTDCTADLAMTLLLSIARRAGEGERHVRSKQWTGWRPTHMMGTSVSGKTLGLIGMGRIARAVASRAAHGFSMKIIFYDPYPPLEQDIAGLNARRCSSPQEVFAQISESEVGRCVRTHRWKYSVRAEGLAGWDHAGSDRYTESFLYDLQADPYELTNLIQVESHRPVAAVMRGRLLRRMRDAGEKEPEIIAPEKILPAGQRIVEESEFSQ